MTFIKLCMASFAVYLGIASMPAHANDPTVVYIGLNTLKSEQRADHMKAFHAYINDLIPIMDRHDMGLEVYRIDHQNNDGQQVDYITIGTAPSMEAMQSFFADSSFLAIFPRLEAALSDHTVVFLDQVLSGPMTQEGYLLLTLDWLDDPNSKNKVGELNASLVDLGREHGASQLGRAGGVMSNRGLGPDMYSVDPPHYVSLWQMSDPHEFLEHGIVAMKNKDMAKLMKEGREFWVTRQHY